MDEWVNVQITQAMALWKTVKLYYLPLDTTPYLRPLKDNLMDGVFQIEISFSFVFQNYTFKIIITKCQAAVHWCQRGNFEVI